MNINRVIITGNLGGDPDTKTLPSGVDLAEFSVAVNGRIKRDDEWRDKTNWVRVTAFGKTAENIGKYLRKGSGVAIDGRLDYQEWETDGNKRTTIKIIADTVQFLNSNTDGGQAEAAQISGGADVPEDDIPF